MFFSPIIFGLRRFKIQKKKYKFCTKKMVRSGLRRIFIEDVCNISGSDSKNGVDFGRGIIFQQLT